MGLVDYINGYPPENSSEVYPGRYRSVVVISVKVLMKPIEMIAWFTQDGLPTPIRFRMEQPDGSYIVIKVAQTISRKEEKLAGNPIIVFTCRSQVHGIERLLSCYELRTCKWYIYKI